jgi:tRNA (mo5U34)-methyltransferase
MLDTHIATPDTAKHEYEIAGSTYKYRRHTESGIGEVFSGMYEHAKWLLLDDIKKTLGLAGFQEIKVVEVREERNGPRALLFARKAG